MAKDDLVFCHYRCVATAQRQHQITRHVQTLEANGEERVMEGIVLYRIANGKFTDLWHYSNMLEGMAEWGPQATEGDAAR